MRLLTFLLPLLLAGLVATAAASHPEPVRGPGVKSPIGTDARAEAAKVQNLFRARCLGCHGGIKQQGGLSLLRREGAIAAADSGRRAVVPQAPGESELLRRVTARSGRMPPTGEPLTAAEIALLRRWIAAGAAWPRHWAFEPLGRRTVPATSKVKGQKSKETADGGWGRNPIDAFVLQRLQREGLRPSPEADPYTLIRRLSLDLTGLPPTPEEVDAFEREVDAERKAVPGGSDGSDGSAGSVRPAPNTQRPTLNTRSAYERLVDRLLASPHYGERWGRHWLDLARYADSDGYEVDKPRPNAWYWRDWVINAFNTDLPFDEFTVQQLAGDVLAKETGKSEIGDPGVRVSTSQSSISSLQSPISPLIATGFHRNTLTNNEGGVDREEYRVKAVFDRVSTTGTVWLGLTVGCAQCHDHPQDPVTQREYYGLYAIFNNADETEAEVPAGPGRSGRPAKVAVLTERATPRPTFLFDRGDFLRPRADAPVAPGIPGLPHPFRPRRPGGPADRLDLARWLVDPVNPLTPRVAVNHVWLRLFGQGLVRTPDDFGTAGEPPTHPELLDWLAVAIQSGDGVAGDYGSGGVGKFGSGRAGLDSSVSHTPTPPHPHTAAKPWSLKSFIRLIVTSATYRQASAVRESGASRDPENRLLWRQNRWRVEAETVRDLHLAASGLLSRKIGGPSVFPPIPKELEKLTFRSQLPWKTSTGEDRYRRGMYTFVKRSIPDPNLVVFDCPDASATLARRHTSNTPLQALATLNNEVYVEAARALARRLLAPAAPGDGARLEHAFRLCLGRPPQREEQDRVLALLERSRTYYREHGDEARRFAAWTTEEGADPAEVAAWTSVASILTNLDEFITRE